MQERTQFTVKSLSQEIIDQTRVAAKAKGVKLGSWVESALRAALVPEEQRLDELLRQAAKIQKKTFDALINEGFDERHAIAILIDNASRTPSN